MEYREEEEYFLLNFKDAVDQKFFAKPNLFFKIVNLESKRPLFQIGNHVFAAKTDEESLGTSLIFEEQEDFPSKNIYEKETNIHLKYIAKTCKFYSLLWQKLPEEVPDIEASELVDLEFKHSYATVLKELEDGDLDINDAVKQPEEELNELLCAMEAPQPKHSATSNLSEEATPKVKPRRKKVPVEDSEEVEEYTMLKEMVHPQINDPEYYKWLPETQEEFTSEKEYKIMKEIYFKSFDYENWEFEAGKSSLWKFVNLQGSIDAGVIEMKERYTPEDRAKLFSMENFDNFSSELKVKVLIDYLKEEKEAIHSMSQLEQLAEDEFGRTAKQRYRMVKSLVKDLQYNLFSESLRTYHTFDSLDE